MKLRWIRKVQDLGRVQIPTEYLESYGTKIGDFVMIRIKEDDENTLLLTFNVDEKGRRKRRED